VLMLSTYQLFLAPAGVGLAYITIWLLVMYLGTSILGLAFPAWAATLAKDYHERSRLFGLAAPGGMIGSLTMLCIPTVAKMFGHGDAESVRMMGWLILAITPIAIILVVVSVPERITRNANTERFQPKEYLDLLRKPTLLRLFLGQLCLTMGPGWLGAIYLFFATSVLGFTLPQASILLAASVIGSAAGGVAFAQISKRIGKHYTLMIGTTGYALGLFSYLLVHDGNMYLGVPIVTFLGFTQTGFTLMVQAMMADVGDEVRLEQGRERIGLLYSVITLATKLSGAGAIWLTYQVLAAIGFNAGEGAANTPHALLGLQLAYYVGPTAFVMLGGLCFLGWPLNAARHAEIRRELDARDALLSNVPQASGVAVGEALADLLVEPE